MKMKRLLSSALVLVFSICLLSTSVSAADLDIPVEEMPPSDVVVLDYESEIVPLTNTGFSFSLAADKYKTSSETYYIYENKGKLQISSLTWTPTGQSVNVGFCNVNTNQFYTVRYTGGTVSNRNITTEGVPEGEYYIVVWNTGTNDISGSINYMMT